MERLSGSDAWYLSLETPSAPMVVTGVIGLDPSTAPDGFDPASLRTHMADRVPLIPAFRRRLATVPLSADRPRWVDDPDFDLDHHLSLHRFDEPASHDDLATYIGELMSRRLPRDRPLWEMTLLEGLTGGAAAVVLRMHHAIVDGISGVALMADLFDLTPDSPRRTEDDPGWDPEAMPSATRLLGDGLGARIAEPLRPLQILSRTTRALADAGLATAAQRRRGSTAAGQPMNAPRTPFNRSLTPERSVAFTSRPFEEFRRLRHHFGVTINDVVMCATGIGLRNHLSDLGEAVDRPLVVSVPVSVHGAADDASSNQVSAMFVELPMGLDDPATMLAAVSRSSTASKEVNAAMGSDLIGDVAELIPGPVFSVGVDLYKRLGLADRLPPVHNLVISNVAGAPVPVFMAGAKVTGMWPFGPLLEGAGLNVTVFSADGEMMLGVVTCPELIPDVRKVLDAIGQGLDALTAAADRGDQLPPTTES
ncbi:wax ester/triacylglycerol synthase family O-acyltransferase [Candidatus Microthrix sp.]|jgi:diacylglycerol O-acyltransferase|uniref:wax ester/triacylglycerol synthase family O-acyltransferase n=1 Tax=Candidatus Neomicrothrix sp. TaxID=2719034 RepID=UPI000E9C85CE|nr:wax ester/triacylglycerol synthase family O-acyltransferase [Candidatus Microthrix sp.]MBP7852414.1 wax ester/triacylglycerol synthase family O-acyltransferase [Candidatus Microthrix sp.]MBP7876769.1 wax ester/triacylglycerol synthase family O-acyltransferase [Candidatus Microthrix sp.]MBP9619725.1 wax ester/triacylglycerol synthase family O-acyltransferase [Candidatus Microthrix sp.]HBX09447.1 wax ester/triacylglycerol synthase family O-acyltransferase [Candidatus Microthrix parvicella]